MAAGVVAALGLRTGMVAGPWAVLVFSLYAYAGLWFLRVPFLPIATVGTAVAFYVGFKNNAAYERFWEGRKIWGGIVNASRTWATAVVSYIDVGDAGDDAKATRRELVYRHLAWINALRLQLRKTSRFHDKPARSTKRRLERHAEHMRNDWNAELSPFLSAEELTATSTVANAATHLLAHQGTRIAAAGDLNIDAATETRGERHLAATRSSGLLRSGLGVTLGSRELSVDGLTDSTRAVASVVGSTAGSLQIQAGKALRLAGSDLQAPSGDIALQAPRIDIAEARETLHTQTETRFRQSGITVAVSTPALTALQTAQQMNRAASQTQDPRMKALAAASTALSAYSAGQAVMAGQGVTLPDGRTGQIVTGKDDTGAPIAPEVAAIEQLAEDLAARGTRLVVVELPVRASAPGAPDAKARRVTHEAMVGVEEAGCAERLDLRDLVQDDRYWSDASHVNGAGTQEISEAVGAWLAENPDSPEGC